MARDVSMRRVFQRPVLWILILGAVVLYAGVAFVKTPVEVLPQFDYPQISVTAHLPGTTATELEHLVAYPLERQILTLTGHECVKCHLYLPIVYKVLHAFLCLMTDAISL